MRRNPIRSARLSAEFKRAARTVVRAGRSLAKARRRIDPATGAAPDEVWDDVERKTNTLLRAVERLAGLPRKALGDESSA